LPDNRLYSQVGKVLLFCGRKRCALAGNGSRGRRVMLAGMQNCFFVVKGYWSLQDSGM